MIESSVGQAYFYILLKWTVVFAGVYFAYRLVDSILLLFRIKMLSMGPCKALKKLEHRIKRLEYTQIEREPKEN